MEELLKREKEVEGAGGVKKSLRSKMRGRLGPRVVNNRGSGTMRETYTREQERHRQS